MCTEPLYAIRLKTQFDIKFERFGKRSPIIVLKSVREIGKDTSVLNYDRSMYDLLMISCGQCMACRLERVKKRAVMCMCESLEHKDNSFITLTFGYPQLYAYYRHKKGLSHYLASKKAHFHEWSLEIEFYQKFMKRLRHWYYNFQLTHFLLSKGREDLVYTRKRSGDSEYLVVKSHIRIPLSERPFLLKDFKPKTIRCFHVGEYGSQKFRPHHHAILFGFQFPDLAEIYEDGKKYYTSEILSSLWPFGIHRIGECTYDSCCYVARYVTKKLYGNDVMFYDGRKPEYATYSTRPILGANYFIKNYKEIVNTQELCVVSDKKYRCTMPKSYDNILKDLDLDMYNRMKEERVKNAQKDLDELFKQKRSIYSKMDSENKIVYSKLNKLVRGFEELPFNHDKNFLKAKAFGLNPKMFVTHPQNAIEFLKKKDYKSHRSKSSNDDIHQMYYNFELMRKRLINNCYQINWSDEKVYTKIDHYLKMDNPFKVEKRGYTMLDSESIDREEYIDEKGDVYG